MRFILIRSAAVLLCRRHAEQRRQQKALQVESHEGHQHELHHYQESVRQTTYITDPRQHIIRGSVEGEEFRIQVDLQAAELVKAGRLFRRVLIPGAGLGQVVVQLEQLIEIVLSILQVVRLILKLLDEDLGVDPIRILFVELLVSDDRVALDRSLAVQLGVDALLVDQDVPVGRPHVIDLLL